MKSVAIILIIVTLKEVSTLKCYTTDFPSILEGNIKAGPIVEDCQTFMKKISQEKNTNLSFNHPDEHRCFTIKLDTDQTNMFVQGCTVGEKCAEFTNDSSFETFKLVLKPFSLQEIHCFECAGELCNAGITQTITAKDSTKSPKTYVIIAIVTFALISIIIFLVMKAVLRRRTIKYSSMVVSDE